MKSLHAQDMHPVNERDVSEYDVPHTHIHINALAVHDNGNGTFTIQVKGRKLSEAELKLMESLFPSFFYEAEKLLQKEALVASLASDADMAKPSRNKK